jgi:ferrous iron transport protein B
VLEITDRVVFALNLMDEAKRHGLEVSARKLSRELGAPVIPTVARSGQGITDLMQAVEDVASGAVRNKPRHVTILDEGFNQAVSELAASLQRLFPDLPNTRWVAIRLLDGDERMTAAVQTGELTELVEAQHIRHPQAAPEAVPA